MSKQWFAATVLACMVLAGCQGEAPEPDRPAVPAEVAAPADPDVAPAGEEEAGRQASTAVPSLRIDTIDGEPYDLVDHRGQWVVVNFWATWCAPCREEMPELSALGAMRGHVEVVGLAYEEIELEAMHAFLEQYPVTYPIAIVDVYDPPADFDTPRGLPMTYLIAPDGSIARQFLGPITAQDIEEAIAAAGGPPVPDETVEPAA